VGQNDPGAKDSCELFLIPENLLQMFETCKMHRIFPVIQKNTNDLPKCSEK
jgi:hypothetical protein